MFVIQRSINTFRLGTKLLIHDTLKTSVPILILKNRVISYSKMGSSNCKSFSPSKAANKTSTAKTQQCSSSSSKTPPNNPPRKNSCAAPEDYVEAVVCHENDLNENEMKSFELGEGKVLVVKQNGVVSAIGSKCTHYGAPLSGGALGDGRVRCQWHGACFNIKTGDIEDFPGLDSLPCFQVTIENGNVKVKGKKTEVETSKRIKGMVKRNHQDVETIVVIGGGPSGATCVETLRQEGFTGRVVLICKENALPYDRVKVSKSLDTDISKLQFRKDSFYEENQIEVIKSTEATGIDTGAKVVSLSSGNTIKFTKCYVATGLNAKIPDIAGCSLRNIITMRNFTDSKDVLSLLSTTKELVCVGGSFVGLEAAAYCVNKVAKVTVVIRDTVPFRGSFGEEIGRRIMEFFEEKGIHFVLGASLVSFEGSEGVVSGVTLSNGTKVLCDFCIVGIGSTLYTDFLKSSGVELRMDGSIPVNHYLETNIPGIYAGGDIAFAPVYCNDQTPAVIGHYPLAHYHGRIAALNMIGKQTELKAVPFFWTQLFGKSFRYAGYGKHDDIVINGSLKDLKYVAFYFKGDLVIGMSSCNRDPLVAKFAELLSQGKRLMRAEALDTKNGWVL